MPTSLLIVLGLAFFLYGIIIGSFLNVLIYRIPQKENIAIKRSHCMTCDYQLRWYDLVPLFSWLFLRGRCRKCGQKISVQYPIIEALNGIFWLLIFIRFGLSVESLLYCFMFSALLALSVIDFRTFEIPIGFNIFILILGLVRVATDYKNWLYYVIGLVSVSLVLFLIFVISKGRAIGGGDVKLMAATGLLLGWDYNLLGFVFGCILGSVIHIIRMKVSKKDHVLAMGPYLSAGVMISIFVGKYLISWYAALLGSH